jgi:murein DD-endopeptidase MepM/ murein hydrolase activator NlpD
VSRRRATRAALALAALAALALPPAGAAAQEFSYLPAGDLIPGSGEGRADGAVYAPGMRFPFEEGPAFANSQVYNKGGSAGPQGAQCDASNYAYPWRDNFCETRSWSMPLCPAGTGHQGQDIRPPTCEAGRHWVVAVADGTITSVGSYSVYLTGDDGTQYEYLHMSDVQVSPGQAVSRGERVGRVSNVFGSTPTTIHLHFNLRQLVSGVGTVFVPPYTSLVASYRALLNAPPRGAIEEAGCDGISGWTDDPDEQGTPSSVRLTFDGAATEPDVDGTTVPAATRRDDLCAELGSCDHGFQVALPLSLLGGEHVVHAYGVDTESGDGVELTGSPKAFTCALVLPDGVRRPLSAEATLDAWRFSLFWDVASAPDAALEALPAGEALPDAPRLVRGEGGAFDVSLLDGAQRRAVPTAEVADAWELDVDAADTWQAARLDALPVGPPLPARPFLVRGSGPGLYLIDAPHAAPAPHAPDAGAGGAAATPAAATTADAVGLQGHVRCDCAAAGADDVRGAGAAWRLGLLAAALCARRRRRLQSTADRAR